MKTLLIGEEAQNEFMTSKKEQIEGGKSLAVGTFKLGTFCKVENDIKGKAVVYYGYPLLNDSGEDVGLLTYNAINKVTLTDFDLNMVESEKHKKVYLIPTAINEIVRLGDFPFIKSESVTIKLANKKGKQVPFKDYPVTDSGKNQANFRFYTKHQKKRKEHSFCWYKNSS